MNALSAEVLLGVWERSYALHPIERALALLAAAWPEINAEEWASVSIGERDARLLDLQDALFGTELQTITECPRCGERLESSFCTEDIRTKSMVPAGSSAELSLRQSDFEIDYRLPTSADLLEVTSRAPGEGGGATLLQRCVREVRRGGVPWQRTELPEEVARAVADDMARHDPDADIRIALSCPNCQHGWSMGFDIVSYLWSEVGDWAGRVLQEVHILATAYGWSERDILAMSATRRRLYLELAQS